MKPDHRTERAKTNREHIYDAAISLIRESEFDSVTMSDIAESAGVARASVFNHFPSKMSFLGEWYERFTLQALEDARMQTSGSCRARLFSLLDIFAKGAVDHKDMVRHIASLAMGGGPLSEKESALDNELRIYFADLVDEGKQSGEINHDLPTDFLADYFVGLLTVTAHDWVNGGQVSDLAEDLRLRFDALFDGITVKQ